MKEKNPTTQKPRTPKSTKVPKAPSAFDNLPRTSDSYQPNPEKMFMLSMPVQFGRFKARVFGGPFRNYIKGQRRLVGIKMALEIQHPHEFKVDTLDYSVPSMQAMHAGIRYGLEKIIEGCDLYVGCMGGTGRTGLYMACLAKVMQEYDGGDLPLKTPEVSYSFVPVQYVRDYYKPHAVETEEQIEFVSKFDTSAHLKWLDAVLHPVREVEVVKEVTKEVVREVPVYYWNPLRALRQWWDQNDPKFDRYPRS
jgi:hypothetical protein